MREADFGPVDGAIADGFDEGEGSVVLGVEDDFLCSCLRVVLSVEVCCVSWGDMCTCSCLTLSMFVSLEGKIG